MSKDKYNTIYNPIHFVHLIKMNETYPIKI